MGEDGDIFYSEWNRNYRYRTSYGDYIVPASTFSDIFEGFNLDDLYTEKIKEENKLYEVRCEKFDEILYDVLLDFSDSNLKLIRPVLLGSWSVEERIVIEGSDRETTLTYDPDAHEISGLVWMSLGDRDLTEITLEEIEIIRRSLLIWIYENI
jgi:hypothetical protein